MPLYRVAHKCINSKVKDAIPNRKDIKIYFENFYMYKWVNLHIQYLAHEFKSQKSVYAVA